MSRSHIGVSLSPILYKISKKVYARTTYQTPPLALGAQDTSPSREHAASLFCPDVTFPGTCFC